MAEKTLAELAAGLKARQYSSVELTQAYLARIEQAQPALNALITVTAESALAAAAVPEYAMLLLAHVRGGPKAVRGDTPTNAPEQSESDGGSSTLKRWPLGHPRQPL